MRAMPRKARTPIRPKDERVQKFGAVNTRVVDGHGDWTREQAAALVRQGYTPEHVAARTGFRLDFLRAQAR